MYSSAVIAHDGSILFGSFDSFVYALTRCRLIIYTLGPHLTCCAHCVCDFILSVYLLVYSIQPSSTIPRLHLIRSSSSGDLKWKFQTGARVQTQGALGPDGTAYFGSGDGKVYALRTSDGSLQVATFQFYSCFFQHSSCSRCNAVVLFHRRPHRRLLRPWQPRRALRAFIRQERVRAANSRQQRWHRFVELHNQRSRCRRALFLILFFHPLFRLVRRSPLRAANRTLACLELDLQLRRSSVDLRHGEPSCLLHRRFRPRVNRE